MQLHSSDTPGLNRFTRHEPGYVTINETRYRGNLLVFPETLEQDWTTHDPDTLVIADFALLAERLATARVNILLLGMGERQRFPAPALCAPLVAARIGFEIMTTPAACRTFNILVAERRRVAAALLLRKTVEQAQDGMPSATA
ncbi:MAG: Mth938-like domain-containing protein [Zoogloeaceae bacterium]|nr:Mth938-like domain-containing protein [Zoogloeaceae bacterium]